MPGLPTHLVRKQTTHRTQRNSAAHRVRDQNHRVLFFKFDDQIAKSFPRRIGRIDSRGIRQGVHFMSRMVTWPIEFPNTRRRAEHMWVEDVAQSITEVLVALMCFTNRVREAMNNNCSYSRVAN